MRVLTVPLGMPSSRPATGGFAKAHLTYSTAPKDFQAKRLGESIDRGMSISDCWHWVLQDKIYHTLTEHSVLRRFLRQMDAVKQLVE